MLVTSYETLRRLALGCSGPDDGPCLGFTVLIRHGMAAWLRTWAMCPSPLSSVAPSAQMSVLPPIVHLELARVWAQMALARQEVAWM